MILILQKSILQTYRQSGSLDEFKPFIEILLRDYYDPMYDYQNNDGCDARCVFIMGMPGNPLTTMVMTHTLSLPVLFQMQGALRVYHSASLAKMGQELKFRGKRSHLVLGSVQNGTFYPTRGGKVGSGMLTPLSQSNALAYFDESKERVEEGALIKIVMLHDTTRSKSFELLNV